MMRVWSAKTQNMGVKLSVYTAASHVSEVNLDMFFISAQNTTDGGRCIETEFVFPDFTCVGRLFPQGRQYVTLSVPLFSSR